MSDSLTLTREWARMLFEDLQRVYHDGLAEHLDKLFGDAGAYPRADPSRQYNRVIHE